MNTRQRVDLSLSPTAYCESIQLANPHNILLFFLQSFRFVALNITNQTILDIFIFGLNWVESSQQNRDRHEEREIYALRGCLCLREGLWLQVHQLVVRALNPSKQTTTLYTLLSSSLPSKHHLSFLVLMELSMRLLQSYCGVPHT